MNTTRRYPRTMAEAFGPHTSNHIDEPAPPPTPLAWRVMYAVALLALVVIVATSCEPQPLQPAVVKEAK